MSIEHRKEKLTSELSRRIDLYTERRYLGPATVTSLFLLCCLWLLPYLIPEYFSAAFGVIGYSDWATKVVFLIIFFIGFVVIKSVLNLIISQSPVEQLQEGIMSGYAQKANADRKWITWIVAGALSAAHTMFYFAIAISTTQ